MRFKQFIKNNYSLKIKLETIQGMDSKKGNTMTEKAMG